MEKESLTCFQNRLRSLAGDGEIPDLLKALHERCGGQWLYSVNHDYKLYPETPELSRVFFDPDSWKACPANPDFPGIREYSWEDERESFHFIYGRLTVGGTEHHLLQLRSLGGFTREDYLMVDYATLLAGYLKPLPSTAAGIRSYMTRAYRGEAPEKLSEGLFPEQGYAAVLTEQGKKGLLRKQSYLGYQLFREFRQELRYCFLDERSMLLFFSGRDPDRDVDRIRKILNMEGEELTLGISDCHPVSEMHLAMREAKHALETGQLMDPQQQVFFYARLGIFQILEYSAEDSPAKRMIKRMENQLQAYAPAKQKVLAATMHAFVESGFNYQKTADAMYVHVNTIRYRIDLLEKLWGCDLQREEDRLLFRVVGRLMPAWKREHQEKTE